MSNLTRFGRKIPLPSTRQIRHELLVLGASEQARIKELDKKKAEADPAPPPPSSD